MEEGETIYVRFRVHHFITYQTILLFFELNVLNYCIFLVIFISCRPKTKSCPFYDFFSI